MKQILARKITRFATVGAANTLVYALATQAYADVFAISAAVASGLGYVTAVPFAFFGHRNLTFDAKGVVWPQFARFIGNHSLGFLLSVFITWLSTDCFFQPIWVGVWVSGLIIPIVSYFVMDAWVFGKP